MGTSSKGPALPAASPAGRCRGTRSRADGDRRKLRAAELEGSLCALRVPSERETAPEMNPHARDFANLVNESISS